MTPDTLLGQPVADTIPDSLRVYRVPEVEGRPPAGVATAVWIFERADLLALRGLSLADLLAQVPGITRLRGGDYGAPETVTAYGLAGGGIRLFWDGFEQIPLHGSVADLSLIGLGGVERVRVERHPGELRVELTSLHGDEEPRPASLIEAGTGDLDTNFFRGSFVHPRALGGSLGLVLDRVDTNGPNREEGNRMGGWLRYTRHWGDDLALTAEARRMKSGAAIEGFPGEATRTDWVMRARWRPLSGLVLQGYTGRSTLDGLERPERLPVVRGPRAARHHGGPRARTRAGERRAACPRRKRPPFVLGRPVGHGGAPRAGRCRREHLAGALERSDRRAGPPGRLEPPPVRCLDLRKLGVGHAWGAALPAAA